MAIRNTNLGGTDWSTSGTTQLNGSINDSVTTITVDSTSTFKSSGIIKIDNEVITYTGTTATTFTGCTRGVYGTSAASHSDNASVAEKEILFSDDLNDTLDELGNKINTLTMFWLNSDLYETLDDFESYSTGAFTSTGDWTITASGTGTTSEIVSSTNSGGTGKELHIKVTSSSGSVSADYAGFDANHHAHCKIGMSFIADSNTGVNSTTVVRFYVGSTYVVLFEKINQGELWSTEGSVINLDVKVVALGSNQYDVYVGGKKAASSITEATPTLKFYVNAADDATSSTAEMWVDDIRQSRGSV